MPDLNKRIELASRAYHMDYCIEFDEIKSVLEYCNNHVHKFSTLPFRSGNEEVINEIIKRLQAVFKERNYLSDNLEPLPKKYAIFRKIFMYLLLNTDITHKINLHEYTQITHVIGLSPSLPKFLLISLTWELKLDCIFYELLCYAPCWFTLPLIEPALESLRYMDDKLEVLQKVAGIIRAMIISLTLSMYYNLAPYDRITVNESIFELITRFLQRFYCVPEIPNTKKKKHAYARETGFLMKHILELSILIIKAHSNPTCCKPISDLKFYEILSRKNAHTQMADKNIKTNVEALQLKIFTAILNSLQSNVMAVNIETFLYWAEIDLSDNENLQSKIGSMAFELSEQLKSNALYEHDVLEKLLEIAIRPKTLEETIRDANIGEILQNLDIDNSYHLKKPWFDELLNRCICFVNDECIKTIKSNVKMMNVENCKTILDFISADLKRKEAEHKENNTNEEMSVDYEDYEELGSIILKSLNNFKTDDILELLNYQHKILGKNTSVCCQNDDFYLRSTEFFNKYSSNFDIQQFLILCFENPAQIWSKFFDCACHNNGHIVNFCTTVKKSRPFSNAYFFSLLDETMLDTDKIQKKLFPQLLCEVYFTLYYPDNKIHFLKEFINKYVNTYLEQQDYESLLPIVLTLTVISEKGESNSYKRQNFGEVTAPVLLMIAQILDKARWDLITYTDIRDKLVKECIKFITQTSKKFLPVATAKDRKWIADTVKANYRPFTQFYFQKYSLQKDQPHLLFHQFLAPDEPTNADETEMFLLYYFVRCTMKETELLLNNKLLLSHIINVMIIFGGVVEETKNLNALENYRNCVVNFSNIVYKLLLPQTEKDKKMAYKLVFNILKIIKAAPVAVYESIFICLNNVLLAVVEKSLPLEQSECDSLRAYVSNMRNCNAKEIFLQKFNAFTLEHSE